MSTAIQSLRNQLEAKRQDVRRLQAQLHHVQGNIEGLENAIETLERAEKRQARQLSPASMAMEELFGKSKKMKLEDLAYQVLKEASKPLTGDQIIPLMAARGCTSSKQSILGAIYRSMKIGNSPFLKLDSGVFGLSEWAGESEEERAAGTGG